VVIARGENKATEKVHQFIVAKIEKPPQLINITGVF